MNNNFENVSLKNYVDIKKTEQDLLDRIEELTLEIKKIALPLYDLGREYKNIVDASLFPDDFEKLDIEDLILRFKIIRSNIRRSSMDEMEKNATISNIDDVEERLIIKISELALTIENLEKVEQSKKERETYLEDKRLEIDNLKQVIKQEEEKLKKHITGMHTAIELGIAKVVIDAYDTTISKLENNLIQLRVNLNNLLTEPGLREELELYMKIQNISQNEIDDLLEIDNISYLDKNLEEAKESISKKNRKIKLVRKVVPVESQENKIIEEIEQPIIEEKDELEPSKEIIPKEKKELELLVIDESEGHEVKDEQPLVKTSEENTTKEENATKEENIISYPFEKFNNTSMYKKKSELNGISDDLVGKWVVKDENDKYINIDNAKDFQPEDAILVLPDSAIIDSKNGTYEIPDISQLPNNYKENEFLTEQNEEQFNIVSSHRNWELEQKIKLKKGLRVVLGIASLMATTVAISTGAGILTAIPLGIMANNLIRGINDSSEKEEAKSLKRR